MFLSVIYLLSLGGTTVKQILFSFVFLGLLFVLPAWVIAGEHQSARDSQVQAAGPYNLELIAKDGQLQLYVTDRMHNAVQTSGGSANANVIDKDGNRATVQLKPVFGNIMKGSGDFKITPDTKISVLLAMDEKGTHVARFSFKGEPETAPAQTTESDNHQPHEGASENGSSDED